MPTPKALLYRQKDKLLRLIVLKVQKSVCLKIYVAKLVIHQRLVFKHKLIHISQIALECYSGHKCLRHWNCIVCKDTMIIPYQDALTKSWDDLRAICQWKTTRFSHPMHHFEYQWKPHNFNCAKIKESIATSIRKYRYQTLAWAHNSVSNLNHTGCFWFKSWSNILDVRFI